MARRKRPSNTQRHPGKKNSQLWYRPEDYALVQAAAKIARRSMANFAIVATLAEARRVEAAANNAEVIDR